jgi:hypothetical protein
MSLQDDAERTSTFSDRLPGLDPGQHWVEGHYAEGRRGYVWVPGHWSRDPAGEALSERNRQGGEVEFDPWQITEQKERLALARQRLREEHDL